MIGTQRNDLFQYVYPKSSVPRVLEVIIVIDIDEQRTSISRTEDQFRSVARVRLSSRIKSIPGASYPVRLPHNIFLFVSIDLSGGCALARVSPDYWKWTQRSG